MSREGTTSMTDSDARISEPLGYLVVVEPDGGKRSVPIFDQIFVGRECAGIREDRRIVLDDPEVSRTHVEIRLDGAADQAYLIDTSTNGTLLNGVRLERAVPMRIKPGDEFRLGDYGLTFLSGRFDTTGTGDAVPTPTRISTSAMVMVVGDVTNFAQISESTDYTVIARSLNLLWRDLGNILREHRGRLNHYAGDALYAVWELRTLPAANELAIDFALAANQRVMDLGPNLPMRTADGDPIQMGWGVVQGMAALASMTRSVESVIGDSTNLAFRLASMAGREDRAAVMVSKGVYNATWTKFVWGESAEVTIKGRTGFETVYPVTARAKTVAKAGQTVPIERPTWLPRRAEEA